MNVLTAALLIFAALAVVVVILFIISPRLRDNLAQFNNDVKAQLSEALETPTMLPTVASVAQIPTVPTATATSLQPTWTPETPQATATIRPSKVDRPSDVTGMVDTGKLIGVLTQDDAV
ncbi:MAG: hypothetical protein GWP17_03005, partial [Aquificales bacterium]|nr:hypothetical protein [Aquificales bacterium]